jgi:hypothetical protein
VFWDWLISCCPHDTTLQVEFFPFLFHVSKRRAEVSVICVCTRRAHTDQKRQSLKTKKNLKKTVQISPGRTKVGKNNQQKVQLHEPWDTKLEELKNPANLMRNSFLESSSTCDFRA